MATIEFMKFYAMRLQKLLLMIIIGLSMIKPVTAAYFCYFGKDINSLNALQNQSCTTGELHLLSSLLLTEQQTLSSNVDKQTMSDVEQEEKKHSFCYAFRFVEVLLLANDVKKESVHVEFGCDLDSLNICEKQPLDQILKNKTVGHHNGQLLCCYGENCNDLEKIHLPAENRVCFEGVKNKTDVPDGGLNSCKQPDVVCAKRTVYMSDGKIERYFCDNKRECFQPLMTSGAYKSCTNTSIGYNTTEELCCCDQNRCYLPTWFTSPLNVKNGTSDNEPLLRTNAIDNPMQEKNEKAIITGLAAIFLFIIGFGAGFILVVACKRHRKPRRDPNVIMQYERLASDPDMEDAVVL
ncbi:unnamed protein product [Lymnaea stagnalis]|uniref:Uncharacterized protein n=1 Tax=Lymnaea stagnalis TaxID=6523 RepID=A0AAV2I0W5_LYMST